MRDNRDAKLMARTMRDELAARGHSISAGESLEIIAHMFGLSDWNTLSALIRKRQPPAPAEPAGPAGSAAVEGDEIGLAPHILDNYVGTYQLGGASLLTVTRERGQLSAQLTGQAAFPIYPRSATEFFYKVVDAQISFVLDADGRAVSGILHQNGSSLPMPRIDDAAAARIADRTNEKIADQAQNPHAEAALRQLIADLAGGDPDYDRMSPALAELTRTQLPRLQPGMAGLGPVTSVRFLGVSRQGADAYSVRHEKGETHWHISLDEAGIVTMARVTAGP